MKTRKNCSKRPKHSNDDFVSDFDEASVSSIADPDELDAMRKSRIRDSNKEFARRMTILHAWSQHWSKYETREGDAYPLQEAKNIMKRNRKITCPIQSCRKTYTSIGGLRYHYARCNIERAYKCLVCNPATEVATRGELLRHMILNHCQELPPLNAEQQEIVSSYFSCENRGDKREKREKRINIETEAHQGTHNLIKNYYDLLTKNYSNGCMPQRCFSDWLVPPKDWDLITHVIERRRFYPPEQDSPTILLPSSGISTSLKVGEFKTLQVDKRNNPTSFLFYTGGINTATAWLPKSPLDPSPSHELLSVAVNCCSMEQSFTFKESLHNEGCIQFWSFENGTIRGDSCINENNYMDHKPVNISLKYMVGHSYGTIFEMSWCPLGTSWLPSDLCKDVPYSRDGLLALACGDGQIRILCVPDRKFLLSKAQLRDSESTLDCTPMFCAKPIANLMPPGIGHSSDIQTMSCKSISWSIDNNQKLIIAGYVNGNVAIYDLENRSPILYVQFEFRHVYQPLKCWFAHGGPVTSVAISSPYGDNQSLIASGSIDRQVKIYNPLDLSSFIVSDRAPVNKLCWDFRYRGVVTATDQAFTSFNNKVNYRYPVSDGYHSITVSSHRSSVYGLANSIITSSLATSDQAGEVFVLPQLVNRSSYKRDRNLLSTHSLYTMVPFSLKQRELHNNDEEDNGLEADADFSHVERTIVNIPTKFLFPIAHGPVFAYNSFKEGFGLKFIHYSSTPARVDSRQSESCLRAVDMKDIYCDRPCDYPFSSINDVIWSPNPGTFPYLLSAGQIGFCRLDRVQIVEQIYGSHVENLKPSSFFS